MNKFFTKVLLIVTTLSGTLVFFIFLLLAYLCFDLFDKNELCSFFALDWSVERGEYGILVPLLGSFIVSFLALIMGFIFSFSLSSYIFLTKNKILKIFFEKSILLMASVPTVIYAFAALFTYVPFVSNYIDESATLCVLVASVTLSLLLIPTMGLIFLNVFKIQSQKYEKTCTNLGLNKDIFFFTFIVKNSLKLLSTGIILALTRALGDTMIALMLAGNALSLPRTIFDPARTLTSHIGLIFANDYNSLGFRAIFLCAFLLLISNFILIVCIKYIQGRKIEYKI